MATRKCRNVYFPKYFMVVRGSSQIFMSRNIFVLLSVNINGTFTYTLFLVCFICHVPLLHTSKKKLRID